MCLIEWQQDVSDERADLAGLRAENAQLRMERDLLNRSLAFWIKETSTP